MNEFYEVFLVSGNKGMLVEITTHYLGQDGKQYSAKVWLDTVRYPDQRAEALGLLQTATRGDNWQPKQTFRGHDLLKMQTYVDLGIHPMEQ